MITLRILMMVWPLILTTDHYQLYHAMTIEVMMVLLAVAADQGPTSQRARQPASKLHWNSRWDYLKKFQYGNPEWVFLKSLWNSYENPHGHPHSISYLINEFIVFYMSFPTLHGPHTHIYIYIYIHINICIYIYIYIYINMGPIWINIGLGHLA